MELMRVPATAGRLHPSAAVSQVLPAAAFEHPRGDFNLHAQPSRTETRSCTRSGWGSGTKWLSSKLAVMASASSPGHKGAVTEHEIQCPVADHVHPGAGRKAQPVPGQQRSCGNLLPAQAAANQDEK